MVLFKNRTDNRPVFLNLFQIQLPVCALVSILHRVTGVFFVLTLPILVLFLYEIAVLSHVFLAGFYVWVIKGGQLAVLWALMYHVLAGIRHMFHDFSGVHGLKMTTLSAYLVLFFWVVWIFVTLYKVLMI